MEQELERIAAERCADEGDSQGMLRDTDVEAQSLARPSLALVDGDPPSQDQRQLPALHAFDAIMLRGRGLYGHPFGVFGEDGLLLPRFVI